MTAAERLSSKKSHYLLMSFRSIFRFILTITECTNRQDHAASSDIS